MRSPAIFTSVTQVFIPQQLKNTVTISIGCGAAVAITGRAVPHKNTGGGARALRIGADGDLYIMPVAAAWDKTPSLYKGCSAGSTEGVAVRSVHEASDGTTPTMYLLGLL